MAVCRLGTLPVPPAPLGTQVSTLGCVVDAGANGKTWGFQKQVQSQGFMHHEDRQDPVYVCDFSNNKSYANLFHLKEESLF